MSTVIPENNDTMKEQMKYNSGIRKRTVISIVLGVLLTIALIAFITVLVLYLKGQSSKEEGCNTDRFDVAIRSIGFLCETNDGADAVNCVRCARHLDDQEQCEAETNGINSICTFDTTEGLCRRA
ncbi:uncharacterized protein LOC134233150 [Saccostrea cucullata]|uniref:uncharacterized protein LOC134233150 n=1 Tax=Saccostrea cuccullata TaxID=36930 RepID=UPI002ED204DE